MQDRDNFLLFLDRWAAGGMLGLAIGAFAQVHSPGVYALLAVLGSVLTPTFFAITAKLRK